MMLLIGIAYRQVVVYPLLFEVSWTVSFYVTH